MTKPTDREPLVSIVVPVYNGERFLEESLDSILGQTYRNVEVLAMDDASTDRAPEILQRAAEADPRMRVHRQPENRGIFGNINEGLKLAAGDFVAIHHSDDLYDSGLLAREVEYLLTHPEVGAVFCLDRFIDEEGREYGRVELPADIRAGEPLDYRSVLNGVLSHQNVFIRGGSSLVRRTVYDEVGPFEPGYDLRADLDMWLRMARRHPIAILDEYLVSYRYGHDNSSARYDRLRKEPELWFSVVDRFLRNGGGELAESAALAAYEGHRADDFLTVTVNRYIAGGDAVASLARVRPGAILRTGRVARGRLLLLWAALQALVRLPRIRVVADALERRFERGGRR